MRDYRCYMHNLICTLLKRLFCSFPWTIDLGFAFTLFCVLLWCLVVVLLLVHVIYFLLVIVEHNKIVFLICLFVSYFVLPHLTLCFSLVFSSVFFSLLFGVCSVKKKLFCECL